MDMISLDTKLHSLLILCLSFITYYSLRKLIECNNFIMKKRHEKYGYKELGETYIYIFKFPCASFRRDPILESGLWPWARSSRNRWNPWWSSSWAVNPSLCAVWNRTKKRSLWSLIGNSAFDNCATQAWWRRSGFDAQVTRSGIFSTTSSIATVSSSTTVLRPTSENCFFNLKFLIKFDRNFTLHFFWEICIWEKLLINYKSRSRSTSDCVERIQI